jgi:hypothetical protein
MLSITSAHGHGTTGEFFDTEGPKIPFIVYHEFSHYAMHTLYGKAFEDVAEGETNHAGYANPTTGDSYQEGFAAFMAVVIASILWDLIDGDGFVDEDEYYTESLLSHYGQSTSSLENDELRKDEQIKFFGDTLNLFEFDETELSKYRIDIASKYDKNGDGILERGELYEYGKTIEKVKPTIT